MALPPLPEDLAELTAADFAPGEGGAARAWLATLAVLLLALTAGVWRRWHGGEAGLLAIVLAGAGWAAAFVGVWARARRTAVGLVELQDCRAEETDRGRVARLTLAEPASPALAQLELWAPWAALATSGQRLPARVTVNGFGGPKLMPAEPQGESWRLPPAPRAGLGWFYLGLTVVALAAAPSQVVQGPIVQIGQEPWTDSLGRSPWQVTVKLASGPRTVVLSHRQVLGLMDPAGQLALATPGLLPKAQRESQWQRYTPRGRNVRLRQTRLGHWQTTFYLGPVP
jgi:hypothetical protein